MLFQYNVFLKGNGLMPSMLNSSSELFQACATIFGPGINISNDFLDYLQLTSIKTAYRKKALHTHPDRALALGLFADDLNAEFINVQQAYEKLLAFVETKKEGKTGAPRFDGFKTQQKHTAQSHRHEKSGRHNPKNKYHHDHFYTGNIPQGNLMFGQFLYYSGLISWRTLIEAICWQRRQRPLIGQIAVAWQLISYQDVLFVLKVRNFDEKFGECALRIGYISNFDLFALVGKQKKLQRPFGEFFIEKGLLSDHDLIHLARKQQLHNLTSRWDPK